MGRIGKQLITIPQEVDVTIDKALVTVKGPKGELRVQIPEGVKIEKTDDALRVSITTDENRALWGTINRLISNNIVGVTKGFSKQLIISGVGYRANIKGDVLVLEVGFSHSIEFPIPDDVTVELEGNNIINISGIDKQRVGQIAAEIRSVKKPEPYKGKGIAYSDEQIRRKQGKQAVGTTE